MGNACPECNSMTYLDAAHAEIVCSGCSLVVQEGIIEDRPGPFTAHEGHIGPPLHGNMGSISMSTEIWNEARDATGRPLSRRGRDHVFRLAQTKRMEAPQRGKSLYRLRDLVRATCGRLSLPEAVCDRSFHLANQAREKNLFRGIDFEVIVSAAILLATREINRYPGYLDVRELIEASGLKARPKGDGRRRRLMRAYHRMKYSMKILTRLAAEDVLPSVASKLSLTHPQIRHVQSLLRKIRPSSNAVADVAAVIHIAFVEDENPMSQATIAKACGTTEVTMRKYVRIHRKRLS